MARLKKENLKIKKKKKKDTKIAGLLDGTLMQRINRLEKMIGQPGVSASAKKALTNSIRAEKGQKLLP